MKKVLFLIPSLGNGGAEKVLVNLVNNMDKCSFKITIQTLFDEGANKKYLSKDIEYKTFLNHQFRGNSILFSIIPPRILYRLIVNETYDVIASYLEGPTAHILTGCHDKKTKKIQWIHTEFDNEKKYSIGFVSKRKATNAYLFMDKIVCVSQTVKDSFLEYLGINYQNVTILNNTILTSEIHRKTKEQINDINFLPTEINVISAGRIVSAKGYDRLAKVHKHLINDGIKCHIYILGDGKNQNSIMKYLKENGLQNTFTFIGYRDNPYKYIAAADMYICSSRYEGISTAVTESLIVGTPVVSTCCSGAKELLGENNEYGIVVDNNEEGIYQGMKQMLMNNELRRHYATKAYERGKQFSTENTVKAVENMLLEV